jgi:tetratricopeptide (TPR) repeat protein
MLADNLGAESELHFHAGEYAKSLALVEEALKMNQSTNNLWGQAYDYLEMGFVYVDRAEVDRAIAIMTESIRFGDEAGLLACSIGERTELGWIYGCFGDPAKGFALVEESLAILKDKLPSWQALPAAVQMRLHLLNGNIEAASEIARKTIIKPISIGYPRYTVLVEMANVELALARHDYPLALSLCDGLLAQIPKTIRPDVPEVYWRRGEALLGMGETAAAREALREARSRAEALNSRHTLWRILVLLADLETRSENPVEAQACRQQAREIVQFIASRLKLMAMDTAFLQKPEVRALYA